MGIGRPRTTTPCDEELVKLGEELIAWATEDVPLEQRPYRFRFAQWYSLKKGILDKEWDLMLQKEIFRGYYERARVALSNRITDGSIKEGLAHRFLRTYCPEVKHEEDDKFRNEETLKSQLKAQEQSAVTDDQIKRHEDLMKTIKNLQSDRKIDENNKSTDNKSA